MITLKGNTTIIVKIGDSYSDVGATASDNNDGNITHKIVKTGTVNTAKAGTYIIKYNVSDAAGNKAVTVVRTIIVKKDAIETGNIFYVSPDGDDEAGVGTQNKRWATITHAADKAEAGDTVYIKVGTYSNEAINVTYSGTKDKPISFIGYRLIPGDIKSTKRIQALPTKYVLQDEKMPLLLGSSRTNGLTAITINDKSHILFKNIQIRNYQRGIWIQGPNAQFNVIDNILGDTFGGLIIPPPGKHSYDGYGITITNHASHNIIRNSVILNSDGQAFTINESNHNLIENCQAYGNDGRTESLKLINKETNEYALRPDARSPTDYYFIVVGDDNKVLNSYAERKIGLAHYGHGFNIKYHGKDNLIQNCEAKNISGAFVFRHSGVHDNTFENIHAIGSKGESETYGLTFRDGAHNNKVKNYYASGIRHAITFRETSEGDDYGEKYSGRDNTVENGRFENINISFVVHFKSKQSKKGIGTGISYNNIFKNIIFDGRKENNKKTALFYMQAGSKDKGNIVLYPNIRTVS